LDELNKALKGELIMSSSMERLMNSLCTGSLPVMWREVSHPTRRELGSWTMDCLKRMNQMEIWSNKPLLLPNVIWISGLNNPQSFLTAVLQTSAHANALELDRLAIFTEVTKKLDPLDFQQPAQDGVYIYGLTLEVFYLFENKSQNLCCLFSCGWMTLFFFSLLFIYCLTI
jgi:dynein heavy chain, axonemal